MMTIIAIITRAGEHEGERERKNRIIDRGCGGVFLSRIPSRDGYIKGVVDVEVTSTA